MKEQSHKDEMASLLKADFARLRARGVDTRLTQTPDAEPVAPTPPEDVSERHDGDAADSSGRFRRFLRAG